MTGHVMTRREAGRLGGRPVTTGPRPTSIPEHLRPHYTDGVWTSCPDRVLPVRTEPGQVCPLHPRGRAVVVAAVPLGHVGHAQFSALRCVGCGRGRSIRGTSGALWLCDGCADDVDHEWARILDQPFAFAPPPPGDAAMEALKARYLDVLS